LARIAEPAPGELVLDPFCGDGTVAIEAALAYPEAHVTGTDIDPTRLANAAANAGRAGVSLDLAVADAGGAGHHDADAVLTNPPWNLAVDAAGTLAGSLDPFWRALPTRGRLCAVTDADLAAPVALERLGIPIALATRVRLAGRISHVLLAGGGLPAGLAGWRRRAIAAGVVTEEGFC
jgi:tRNA (guanine6-N2)-methyltransferase